MRKIWILALAVLLCMAAAACTKTETKIEEKPVPVQDEPVTEEPAAVAAPEEIAETVDLIPFVPEGNIYFDIHVENAIKNFAVSMDGKAINAEGKSAQIKEGSAVVFSGEADANKSVNVYLIYAKEENGHFVFQKMISRDMDADAVITRLPDTISKLLAGNSRILVILTEQPKGWDRSLSEPLNALLDQLVIE